MEKTASSEKQTFFRKLAEIAGAENVLTDDHSRERYRADGLSPAAVVFASTTEQVSQIVRAGNQSRMSIVPWGGGSKQEAGPCLSAADVILCLKNMSNIIELDASNFTALVEAGVTNGHLQQSLAAQGLLFPLDPPFMERSTLGGTLATNASGPLRAAYGTARDLVLGITAVTPGGDIIHTGGKTMKNVAGLDLCKLLIGSWGTLGVITEAVLRLFPLPEASQTLCLTFSGAEDAFSLVTHLLNSALLPTSVELADNAVGNVLGSPLAEEEVLLLVNVEGSTETIERQHKEISAVAKSNKVRTVTAIEGEKATRFWNTYRAAHRSLLSATPDAVQGKASVPLSKLGEMFGAIKQIGSRHGVKTSIRAHCYNGILYAYIADGKSGAADIVGDLRGAAAGLGGYFTVEAAPLEVRKSVAAFPHREDYFLMKRLKTELDPNNILNPGKSAGG